MSVKVKNFAYDKRFFKTYKPKFLTLSVGSICTGGTGKTPFAKFLMSELEGAFSYVTKGYRSKIYQNRGVVNLKQLDALDPNIYGDEACLMQSKLPKVDVIVSHSKLSGLKFAEQLNPEMIIVDDGLQSRYLQRHYDIAIWHSSHNLCENFLPLGRAREELKRLNKIDLLVIHEPADEQVYKKLKSDLSKFCSAPCIGMRYFIHPTTIEKIKNKKLAAFCSIGNPQAFFASIKKFSNVVFEKTLCDHQPISTSFLENFICKAKEKGAEFAICTEKDFIKLPKNSFNFPIIPTYVQMLPVYDQQHWEVFRDKLQANIRSA